MYSIELIVLLAKDAARKWRKFFYWKRYGLPTISQMQQRPVFDLDRMG